MTDLKLLALDSEDLDVLSAHVQDAVVRVVDMGYARADRRFALLMNRYDWSSDQPRSKGLRKRAGLHFDRVQNVAYAGFDPAAPEGVLNLLALTFTPTPDGVSGVVELTFAGGGTVRLTVECLEARLGDLGSAWAAAAKPAHALD
ncbi:DUF2948 family protein [Devosia sp. BK]|nr:MULTISPECIES: DUF2948 family protein [unclassified Devosia]KQN76971.1 hypothetical protein ASE94_18290 [Devosia sp. Leaf64]KQT49857.1 hypothetical protein ASG47_03745 [Devosia sp. Leaf420]MDV3251889.1 DUF2948 family protein [Devosia sp. BK]